MAVIGPSDESKATYALVCVFFFCLFLFSSPTLSQRFNFHTIFSDKNMPRECITTNRHVGIVPSLYTKSISLILTGIIWLYKNVMYETSILIHLAKGVQSSKVTRIPSTQLSQAEHLSFITENL